MEDLWSGEEAALYLAGDRSGETTGCNITVDGCLP